MSKKEFTHLSPEGNPRMVNVSGKQVTLRTARARAVIKPGPDVLALLADGEIRTAKGPVFHTAIVAGVMAAKKTSELIPFCHPVGLDDCAVTLHVDGDSIVVEATATVAAKTGVEMEAMTAATVAALTVYDMCKAVSPAIEIQSVFLVSKTGGKRDYKRG